MKKFFFVLIVSCFLVACDHESEEPEIQFVPEQTILMYFPWSQDSNDIYLHLLNNISAMQMAVENNRGLGQRKIMVFIAQSSTRAALLDFRYIADNKDQQDGRCVADTIKQYTHLSGKDFTTAAGMTSIFKDVMQASRGTKSYSLIIGCHGMGWLPAGTDIFPNPSTTWAKRELSANNAAAANNGKNIVLTRYFGHSLLKSYQTEVSELSAAVKNTFGKTKFIVFDDCYMSNIEVAYELKEVTENYIASPIEMMIAGLPYRTLGMDLINENYQNVCDKFHAYYSSDAYNQYGALAVTKTSEIDDMANIIKRINAKYPEGSMSAEELKAIQNYDLLDNPVFLDMSDYVMTLCKEKDVALYQEFVNQMDKMIPYKCHTTDFVVTTHQDDMGHPLYGKIKTYSGISISDPSMHPGIQEAKKLTGWWKATH